VKNYRLILEYDGTDFEGWQLQTPERRTLQGCLQDALSRIVGHPVSCVGSGRTDSGVHAEGQVANVELETRLDPDELLRAANANLPPDLAVRALAIAPDGFHARRDARSKHYRYRIWNDPVRSPLRARCSWWVRAPLDLGAIDAALPAVVGEHDFASFRATGSSVRTTVRRLLRAEASGRAGGEIALDFAASGFLRHMVRTLAGTVVEIGLGRREPDDLRRILEARQRSAAGVTAPARGLTLVSVEYAGWASGSGPGWASRPES
jgi:tRNA pseudouridine38-40 synthase